MGRNSRNKNRGGKNQKAAAAPAAPVTSYNRHYGLINQGATCYLNSVLQVLFMTRDFREAVKSSSDPGCMDHHLTSLFDALQKNTAKTEAITTHLRIRKVNEQGDAAECFERILNFSSFDASKIFKGELMNSTRCSTCGKISDETNQLWSLPLTLVDSERKGCSVVDKIRRFLGESNICGENQLFCETCNSKTDSTLTCEMKTPPLVLTLLLKRFQFDYHRMEYRKLTCNMQIPFVLQIPYIGKETDTYELYAMVEHSGELKHGHYTARIKSQDDERWYNFNDTVVTTAQDPSHKSDNKQEYLMSRSAYLLFYKKIDNTLTSDDKVGNTLEQEPLDKRSVEEKQKEKQKDVFEHSYSENKKDESPRLDEPKRKPLIGCEKEGENNTKQSAVVNRGSIKRDLPSESGLSNCVKVVTSKELKKIEAFDRDRKSSFQEQRLDENVSTPVPTTAGLQTCAANKNKTSLYIRLKSSEEKQGGENCRCFMKLFMCAAETQSNNEENKGQEISLKNPGYKPSHTLNNMKSVHASAAVTETAQKRMRPEAIDSLVLNASDLDLLCADFKKMNLNSQEPNGRNRDCSGGMSGQAVTELKSKTDPHPLQAEVKSRNSMEGAGNLKNPRKGKNKIKKVICSFGAT